MVDFFIKSPDDRRSRWWAPKRKTQAYREGWERIFGKKKKHEKQWEEQQEHIKALNEEISLAEQKVLQFRMDDSVGHDRAWFQEQTIAENKLNHLLKIRGDYE